MTSNKSQRFYLALIGFIIVLIVWQSVIWIFDLPAFLFPSPMSVVKRSLELGKNWLPHIWGTVYGTLLGFFIALIAGVILGTLIVHSRVLNLIIMPTLVLLQIVPKMALAPIILVWAGIGVASRVSVVALTAFFPIVISTITGLQSIQPELIDLARSMKMNKWHILWKLRLPNSLPHIFSGLKVASTLSVIGSIISEFVGAQEGIGYIILSAGFVLDTALQFGGLVVVTLFGVIFYGVIIIIEKVSMPWYLAEVELVESSF